LIVAFKSSPASLARVMPFIPVLADTNAAAWVKSSGVRRKLRSSVDAWETAEGLRW
jgi:hypothetical protein